MIDRAVANCRWVELFKNREVEVLTVRQSDHKALLLSMYKGGALNMRRRRIFRFEAKWTLEEEVGAVIEDVWKRRVSVQNLMGQEDIKWKHRAKQNWYKNGDQNTKFFHSCANQRRIKNRVKEIKDDNARVVIEQGEMERRPYVEEEVMIALKQMAPLKSPGPNGYGACFYQAYWGTVREEVCKVLENRLKKVLPLLISNSQSAFILRRLTTDNMMIAYKALHTMKTRQKRKVGSMALKLDMAKTYDRLEWSFVENIMRKMGFGERWIGLVMQCVSSVTYSVLVNGCEIQGVAIAKGGTRGSHLLFADDCVIFERARMAEWHKIHGLLETNGKASGQQLNLQKTTIIFSSNTAESVRQDVQKAVEYLSVDPMRNILAYLLWLKLGRDEVEVVAYILRRIWMRWNSWIFENGFDEAKQVIRATKQAEVEYKEANLRCFQEGVYCSKLRRESARWEKPLREEIKVNWDTTIDEKMKTIGIGVVGRDDQGEIMACLCFVVENQNVACMIEAMASKEL
ncbi:uncharacterized protein LOC122310355 [Carya illinoinensis]|uniref:uncharacterized protein LOC122310355 n=1 Tax=Carya illinoinensis TaxID=32201 RepID=UPI001C719F1E|nr:uncharacterized protein LOC122310355 [Carya illinoinensis]